jgi:hypothetical protein
MIGWILNVVKLNAKFAFHNPLCWRTQFVILWGCLLLLLYPTQQQILGFVSILKTTIDFFNYVYIYLITNVVAKDIKMLHGIMVL